MYARIINNETKQVDVGIGTDIKYYQSIGMIEAEVETAYNGMVYIKGYAPEKPVDVKAAEIRAERDRRIDAMRWRIERYQTQLAAGLPTTDTAETYRDILLYLQYLRDLPNLPEFPDVSVPDFDEWLAGQTVVEEENGGGDE